MSTIRINDNCITGNPRGLINDCLRQQLDATGNWWGANDGPSPPGSGDSVEGNVNVIDFLTDEPEECKRECITICKPELVCASKSKSSPPRRVPPRRVPPRSHQRKRFASRSRQETRVLKTCPSVGLAFHHFIRLVESSSWQIRKARVREGQGEITFVSLS